MRWDPCPEQVEHGCTDHREVVDAGSNVLLVHAKCNQGNCYYNTKVGHKHSDLADRDLMREFSTHCRKQGVGVLYYVQLSRERRSFTYPERRAVGADGKPVLLTSSNPLLASREERPVVCMNGPHRQFIKDVLTELSRGYDFDGFWLDCYNWWGRVNPCFCETCKQTYRSDTGTEIPRSALLGSSEGRRYIEWRRKLNSTILDDVIATVRSVNPKLTVTHNGSGVNPFSDWTFCDSDDYVSHEFHFNEGLGHLSLLCQKNTALKRGVPFEIEIWRFANRLGGARATSRGYQVRPSEALLTEMASIAAHGGFTQYYDQVRPDGTLEGKSLEMLRPAFASLSARQPWSRVGAQIPYAALLWSKATEGFAPPDAQSLHRDALAGSFSALMESHVPVAVLSEREVSGGRMQGARVLIVDAAECLPAECARAIGEFVSEGGGLVVTHRSSLLDARGIGTGNFVLSSLMGVDFKGMSEKWYGYINPEREHPVTAGLTLDFPLSVYETLQTQVRAHAGTDTLAAIINPLRGFHMGYPPHERTGFPALLVRPHGKGRVVYAAAPLGALYHRFNHADNRRLIVNAAKWAAREGPPVKLKAPETVEMVAWRDDPAKRTIIHLINRTGAGLSQGEGSMMHEVIPVHDLELRVARSLAVGTVKLQPGNRPVQSEQAGPWIRITIPKIDTWEVIEIG